MRDLIRISDAELHDLTTPQRLRMLVAIGIAIACGIVSLEGMAALFTDAVVVPLPGMQRLGGQIAWAMGLVAMLIAVTFLVRGVIMRRLQWAIAISLLIHLFLCLSMTAVEFRGPQTIPVQAANSADNPGEEFTLPDYAGTDAPSSDAPWRQATDSETPENELELDRPEMEITEAEKPDAEDTALPEEAQPVESPERQEKIELAADASESMERQTREDAIPEQSSVDQPQVATRAAEDAKLDAQTDRQKQATEAPLTERQMEEFAAAAFKVAAAQLEAIRSESMVAPEEIAFSPATRNIADVQAVTSAAQENIQVETAESQQTLLQEQQMELDRRQAQAASTDSASANLPSSANQPVVRNRTPARAGSVSAASPAAPADGGSVSLARNSAAGAAAAGESVAENVEVASAAGAATQEVSESAGARAGERQTATVPQGLVASGSSSVGSMAVGGSPSNGQVQGARVARSSAGSAQPQLGEVGGSSIAGARSTGRQAGAVGSAANEAGIAGIGSARASNGESLVAGPATTSMERRASGLPSARTSGVPGSVSGRSNSASGAPASSVVAAVRGTEPSAKLGSNEGSVGGTQPRLAMSRAAGTLAGLPTGAAAAEQSGTLVFAGPQASGIGSSGAAAPRIGTIPRRSAGLPGISGPAVSATTPADSTSQPARIAARSGRSGVGNDRPSLASTEVIAGLVKRSVPGLGSSPEARLPDSLSMRTTDARREAAKTLGGSEASEEAVERGLEWLVRNQYPDGHWSIHDFPGEASPDLAEGSFESDSAATGLSLLAFLGAGYTHQTGKYQDSVSRGMKWLLDRQKPNGDLFADETEFVWFYSHGIASIALCEAYGMTKDAALKDPAQLALNFIIESQHPEFGGWRYRPQFESDTSVSGWQLMALKSGEMAGLNVSKDTYTKVASWLDSVQSKTSAGQFSYHPSREASPTMTAEGLLMRQYLGAKRENAELIAGANFLRTRLPDSGQRDAYYWYYATQVMFHMQGEYWNEWNAGLRDLLENAQSKDGATSGSWDPARPAPEKWAKAGGRHYLTCMNLLMLEVYYRHLPLYLELEK